MRNERLKTLGINIKAERLRRDVSQEKLAELINTSRTTISMIETAKQSPTALKLIDIAKALEVDINILVRDV